MTKQQRIDAFVNLGKELLNPNANLTQISTLAQHKNAWYTKANIDKALHAIGQNLTQEKLTDWLAPYPDTASSKTVGLVLAGNIPLVGFHDILSVLIAGFRAKIKVSSDDAMLTTVVLQQLREISPELGERFEIVDRLTDFDLVIATGSDNSARYFDYYFSKKPHIIRRNRNSVAFISGQETKEQLTKLGNDIFDYYGLGCRSVSKLLIPKDYDVAHFFEGIESHQEINSHHKYVNNYDYNKSIYLINGDKHFDNGFLLLKEDERMASPLSVIYYQHYNSVTEAEKYLADNKNNIQCVVSESNLQTDVPVFKFGGSQCPSLSDYADGVNTLDFLFANQ